MQCHYCDKPATRMLVWLKDKRRKPARICLPWCGCDLMTALRRFWAVPGQVREGVDYRVEPLPDGNPNVSTNQEATMGNWAIVIQGVGSHDNEGNPSDADRMAADFTAAMKAAGHSVTSSTFTSGSAKDLNTDFVTTGGRDVQPTPQKPR